MFGNLIIQIFHSYDNYPMCFCCKSHQGHRVCFFLFSSVLSCPSSEYTNLTGTLVVQSACIDSFTRIRLQNLHIQKIMVIMYTRHARNQTVSSSSTRILGANQKCNTIINNGRLTSKISESVIYTKVKITIEWF